nr:BPK_HP1_G0043610.mRNA.1.CDS.1 [Saccharomyces cerevisiae]
MYWSDYSKLIYEIGTMTLKIQNQPDFQNLGSESLTGIPLVVTNLPKITCKSFLMEICIENWKM